MNDDLKFEDVTVQLSGEDGSVFYILGLCARAIRKIHGEEAADRWRRHAVGLHNYDEILWFCQKTLDVR